MVGRATSYDLRYRTVAITGTDTLSWWNNATQASGEPVPGVSGTTDSTRVNNLTQGTTYYFIIKAADEVFNWSGYSNVAVGTTYSCVVGGVQQFSAVADTGQVTVSWSSTPDPDAVSLRLYRAVGATAPLTLYRTLSPTPSSYLDAPLTPGTIYRYQAAWMGAACQGQLTSIVQDTTPGTPPPPPPPPNGGGGSSIHAYPNPSTGSIRLVIDVVASASQAVRLRLYDMNGHWIATLADGSYPPGTNEVMWGRISHDGQRVAPGYYELLGTVGSAKVRERLILLP